MIYLKLVHKLDQEKTLSKHFWNTYVIKAVMFPICDAVGWNTLPREEYFLTNTDESNALK